jgi:hypothetical protein
MFEGTQNINTSVDNYVPTCMKEHRTLILNTRIARLFILGVNVLQQDGTPLAALKNGQK